MDDSKRYHIVFEGKIVEGRNPAQVRKNLARLFHIDEADVDLLFQRAPDIIKRDADAATARELRLAVFAAGAACHSIPAQEPGRGDATGPEHEQLGRENPAQLEEKAKKGQKAPHINKPHAPGADRADKEQRPGQAVDPQPEARVMEGMAQASLVQRLLASVHSFFRLTCCFAPVLLFMALIVRFVYQVDISRAAGVQEKLMLAGRAGTLPVLFWLVFLLALLVEFFIRRPAMRGRTWGQEAMDLWVYDLNGRRPAASAWFMRLVGHLVVCLSCGLLLVVGILRGDRAGAADLFSRTTTRSQVRLEARHVKRALLPIGTAIVIGLVCTAVSWWILHIPLTIR